MNKQQGFSIIELVVALAIGTVLLAGVLSTFVSMKTTSEETSSYGALQENGRLALSLLTNDLLKQGFWGEMSADLSFSSLTSVPNQIASDCSGDGLNNSSFPQTVGNFRELWGKTAANASEINCISDAKIGSDIIQVKRVIAESIDADDREDNRYYLISNMTSGAIFDGDDAAIPVIDYGNIWQYQHHVYYVKEETYGNTTVPILTKGRLRSSDTPPIDFQPLVDGIEMIRFTYGVDLDGDNVVDVFLKPEDMVDDYWDGLNNSKILAVTIYVLARDMEPDINYENKNSYQIAGDAISFVDADGNGDNFRRLLFSATVTLYNARMDTW